MQERQPPLLEAAESGDLEKVNRILAANPTTVEYLYERGRNGRIALHVAVSAGRINIVRRLLEVGREREQYKSKLMLSQVDIRDNNNDLPLFMLYNTIDLEILLCLLDYGSTFNADFLLHAVGNPNRITLLECYKINYPHADQSIDILDKIEKLFKLVEKCDQIAECKQLFNELNALSPDKQVANWVNKEGDTLLHRAAYAGNLVFVKFLIANDAKHKRNKNNYYPYQLAITQDHVAVLDFFVCDGPPFVLANHSVAEAKVTDEFIKNRSKIFKLIDIPNKDKNQRSEIEGFIKENPSAVFWHDGDGDTLLQRTTRGNFTFKLDFESAKFICNHGGRFKRTDFTFLVTHLNAYLAKLGVTEELLNFISLMATNGADIRYPNGYFNLLDIFSRNNMLEVICNLKEICPILEDKSIVNSMLCSATESLNVPNVILLIEKYNADINQTINGENLIGLAICNGFQYYRKDDDVSLIKLIKLIKLLIAKGLRVDSSKAYEHLFTYFDPQVIAYLFYLGAIPIHQVENVAHRSVADNTKKYLCAIVDVFDACHAALDPFKNIFNLAIQNVIHKKLHKTLLSLDTKPQQKEEKSLDDEDKSDFYSKVALQWVDKSGNTLLHRVALKMLDLSSQLELHEARKEVEILKFLLDQGFDPNKKNHEAKTVYDLTTDKTSLSIHFAMGCHFLERGQTEKAAENFNKVSKESVFFLASCLELIALLIEKRVSIVQDRFVKAKEPESEDESHARRFECFKLCCIAKQSAKSESTIQFIETKRAQILSELNESYHQSALKEEKKPHKRKREDESSEVDVNQDQNNTKKIKLSDSPAILLASPRNKSGFDTMSLDSSLVPKINN